MSVFSLNAFRQLLTLPVSKKCLFQSLMRQSTKANRIEGVHSDEETPAPAPAVVVPNSQQSAAQPSTTQPSAEQQTTHSETKTATISHEELMRKTLYNGTLVFLSFFAFAAVNPSIISAIRSFNFPDLNETSWWPIILYNIFAVMDLCGVSFLSRNPKLFSNEYLWLPVCGQFVFVTAFMLIAMGKVFRSDFWTLLFSVLYGFMGGYMNTCTIIAMNGSVEDHERAKAGSYVSFYLIFGVAAGSMLAFVIDLEFL
jgi:hypothetical protein